MTHKDIHERIVAVHEARKLRQAEADKRDTESIKTIQKECGEIGHLIAERDMIVSKVKFCVVCHFMDNSETTEYPTDLSGWPKGTIQ